MVIMLAIFMNLALLFYTARTTYAATLPKQSSGLWTNALKDDTLPTVRSNTTLGLVTNASSVLNASEFFIECSIESPTRRPIPIADYYEVVQQILIRDDALVPRRFNLGPSYDKQLHWRAGQCVIFFFDHRPMLTDAIPIIVVAHVAALIANDCITGARGYKGGTAQVGLNSGFVAVTHVMPPDVMAE